MQAVPFRVKVLGGVNNPIMYALIDFVGLENELYFQWYDSRVETENTLEELRELCKSEP